MTSNFESPDFIRQRISLYDLYFKHYAISVKQLHLEFHWRRVIN